MQIKCTLYSVLNSCIEYRYTLNSLLLLYFIQLHMHKENMSNKYMHACQQKVAKVHNISMHACSHACPSPCLPIKYTCHVCVWSSCHIIIARPDLAPGRCNGHLTDPWHKEGQLGTSRPPPPYCSTGWRTRGCN